VARVLIKSATECNNSGETKRVSEYSTVATSACCLKTRCVFS
jgi:hypothetical protein